MELKGNIRVFVRSRPLLIHEEKLISIKSTDNSTEVLIFLWIHLFIYIYDNINRIYMDIQINHMNKEKLSCMMFR